MLIIGSYIIGILGGTLYFWHLEKSTLKAFEKQDPGSLKNWFRLIVFASSAVILSNGLTLNLILLLLGFLTSNCLFIFKAIEFERVYESN